MDTSLNTLLPFFVNCFFLEVFEFFHSQLVFSPSWIHDSTRYDANIHFPMVVSMQERLASIFLITLISSSLLLLLLT